MAGLNKGILLSFIIIILIGCGESKVNEFLAHIPSSTEINIPVPIYPSPTTFMKVSTYTGSELNALFGKILAVKQYASQTSPSAKTETDILWDSLNGGDYLYSLLIRKTESGNYSFYIDMAHNTPSPQFYSVAEGTTADITTLVIDTKNLHNLDPLKYPDGISVVVAYTKGTTIPVSGFADNFLLYNQADAGPVNGKFYFTDTGEKMCFHFSRSWDYNGDYLYEEVKSTFCWIDTGGKGVGIISGGELENELNLIECWNSDGTILFARYNERVTGNESECPF